MWMNTWEIDQAAYTHRNNKLLGPATKFLQEFRDLVNENSDGWHSWPAPAKAASKLMTAIQNARPIFNGVYNHAPVTEADLKKASIPIKSFCTRYKTKKPEFSKACYEKLSLALKQD